MNDSQKLAADSDGSGTIITFYSYKGGTGRTMALANVAWILASAGKRVLVVDWDLESPGLHKYFHPFLLDKGLRQTRGVIDMVRDFSAAILQPPSEDEATDWVASHADVLRFVVSLDWRFGREQRGSSKTQGFLDLLGAGQQTDTYIQAVSSFDWHAFYERGGRAFLEALSRSMRANYDYILIDSRTGVSDGAGTCTVYLPDTIVAAFALNDQSIDGVLSISKMILNMDVGRRLRLLPVPMRVEAAEHSKREAGREYARRSFASLLEVQGEEAERYWGDVEIPYQPFYAYEEILAVFGDRPHLEGSLLAAYERLTRRITNGQVTELEAMDEITRRRWLLGYERSLPTATEIFLSYAAEDRVWADWIVDELALVGSRVIAREVDSLADMSGTDWTHNVDIAARVVVLLSQDYVHSARATEFWNYAVGREANVGGRLIIPIRLDNQRLPEPFGDRIPSDFGGLTEERTVLELVEALDLPQIQRLQAEGASRGGRRRFPATEPPVWDIPPRNAAFTGRRTLLELIRNQLSSTSNAPQALYGLGGVGKSQTAIEYAHRFRADYDVVWWVSAQQTSMVRSSLADLADELHIGAAGQSIDERAQVALDALRRGVPHKRWLLVFDNVDDPAEIRSLLPESSALGHVLLTTRNHDWLRESTDLIEVTVFERAESLALLRRRMPDIDAAEANVVADRLGDLPLAVEQAGAWLAATGEPVSTYLTRLDARLPEVLSSELPSDYQQTGAQPWLVSLQSLRESRPAAAKVLEICAFFAPEPIPIHLLHSARFLSVLTTIDSSLRDPLLLSPIIKEIGRYALARIDVVRSGADTGKRRRAGDSVEDVRSRAVQLHRLVQGVIRASLTAEEAAENRGHVQAILAAGSPGDPDQPGNWHYYQSTWPHVLASGAELSDSPEIRRFLLDFARYLWRHADYTTCEELTARTIEHWRHVHGDDDPLTLLMQFHRANAFRLQAKYAQAYELDSVTHRRIVASLGESHVYSIVVAGSLAADLRALGRFTEARDLDRRTEELARTELDEDHPRTMVAAHNLALSLRLVGDLRGALKLNESTYMRRRQSGGENHPRTLPTASNYGRDLRDNGYLTQSRRLLETTLETSKIVLGGEHPETLQTAKNLAVTLRKLGEFDQALALDQATFSASIRQLGPQHPDVQACAMSLACDQSALGNEEEAISLARPVYQWYRDNMGTDHLFTLAYGNNVSIFLRKAGDLAESLALNLDVLERFSTAVGPDHFYTLAAKINLASCYYSQHDYLRACELDEACYAQAKIILGSDHPDTLAVANNLATSLSALGNRERAQEVRAVVLPAHLRVLGENHPNTLALQAANRLNCDLEPPPT